MSKFDEFLKSQNTSHVAGEPIEGSFYCQTCHFDVDDAEYFRLQKVLKWTCPEGHVSYLEEFNL